MSKERLVEMEELLKTYYANVDDPFASTDNAMAIVDKVGYFLNRAQELEDRNRQGQEYVNRLDEQMRELEQQNKRYRDLLNRIHDTDDIVEVYDIIDEYKDLEGEE